MEISFWGQCRIDDEMSEEEIKYKKRFERSGGGDEPMAAEKYPLTWKMAEQMCIRDRSRHFPTQTMRLRI